MSARGRFWLTLGGCAAGVLTVVVVAALLVAQTQWFGNFVKDKVVSTVEESTGGKVEIGSFEFDPWHLTVRIRNFILHGTEPANVDPLARIALLELHLKLLAGLKKAVDLAYIGISDPRVNFIVNPDGTTNVPSPKVKKAPSQTSGLQTVVDLAVGQFRIDNGLLMYSQKASKFSAQGQNLQVLLNFNNFNSTYAGNLRINPLVLAVGAGSPLGVQVNLPVLLEKDAISISGGRLNTAESQVLLNGGLRNLNAPHITARLNANVSLAEMRKTFDLPLDTAARNVPSALTADVGAIYDQGSNVIELQTADIKLGQTTFQAAGTLQPGAAPGIQFKGNVALDQLSRLVKMGGTQLNGTLQMNGHATMDARNNYAVNGMLNSSGLGFRSGATRVSNLRLATPFHADPYLISLDGLKLGAFGGDLNAKLFIENMQRLSVEGHLSNFSIPVLAQAFGGHPLGYDGILSGAIVAKSDLKAKGTDGLSAQTRLVIAPGTHGVPLSGRIDGTYNGASGLIALQKSYIAMPNSRLDLAGDINKQLKLNLVSHNLNDFLPAANFGAAKPATTLPITLQGGQASVSARVKGNLSAPQIQAHAAVDHFLVQGSPLQHLALDLAASQTGATITNGAVTSKGLNSNFDASIGLRKWQPGPRSPLSANVSLPSGDLPTILTMAGEKDVPASGKVNAQVHIRGTYGDPLGDASLQLVNGVIDSQPFDKVQMNVDLGHQLITLTSLEVDAAGGQLLANGTFQHPGDSFQVGRAQFHVNTNNIQLANIKPLQQRSPGSAGILNLVADGAGNLQKDGFTVSNISTDFSAQGLQVNHQSAGNLSAQARTVNGSVNYNVHSDFAGSAIQVNGQTSLAKGYATKAVASIQNLLVEKALAIAGHGDIPAKGTLSLDANVSGTLEHPDASANLALSKAVVYSEPLNRFGAKLHYTDTQVDVQSLNVDVPAGTLSASANYIHKDGDLNNGRMELHVNSSDIDLAKIKHLTQVEPGLGGGLKLVADTAGEVRQANGKPEVLLSQANADLSAHSLRANDHDLGELHFTAKTERQVVTYNLESNLAQAKLLASGNTRLTADYPTHAKLTFGNVTYGNIAPFIPSDNRAKPAFDALVDGEATLDGPVTNLDALVARLQLNQLVARTMPSTSPSGAPGTRKVQLQNDGPVIVALDHSVIKIQQLKITGDKTQLQAGGSVSLKATKESLGLNVKGNVDLGVLQDADRDFYSSGNVLLDATVHGSLSNPLLNGRVELKNANINYADAPNGLSNGNGVILLSGSSATIQNLTGESGGGKIFITGFAGFTPSSIVFNLRARTDHVRARYSGASVTSSMDVSLTGNNKRSNVSGTVTVHRIAYTSSSDAGSFLTSASVPPSIPEAPSPFLSGMHLDVRIVTAPDLRVVTTYTQKMSITSTLNIRGTAQNPGVVGRLNVTNGELVFFGNTYTVNTGSINFYDPNAIQPVLDMSLETIAQGVDVTIGVSGPVSNLKLSYRSDPPLTFEQIVQLLATNTTPSDPSIAAHQPLPPQQSMSEMGESAVLGQAVANPLASRAQRVFGLSQFKIDPSIASGTPSARVTLQQKITSNLTFTYITDVTQTNSEIVRVQYDISSNLSAVALRDYNGNVSVEIFYKFQKR